MLDAMSLAAKELASGKALGRQPTGGKTLISEIVPGEQILEPILGSRATNGDRQSVELVHGVPRIPSIGNKAEIFNIVGEADDEDRDSGCNLQVGIFQNARGNSLARSAHDFNIE
jgi:hypothetical protein